jgi:hypothetical protein
VAAGPGDLHRIDILPFLIPLAGPALRFVVIPSAAEGSLFELRTGGAFTRRELPRFISIRFGSLSRDDTAITQGWPGLLMSARSIKRKRIKSRAGWQGRRKSIKHRQVIEAKMKGGK